MAEKVVCSKCVPPLCDGGLIVWDSHLWWNPTVFQMPTTVGFGSLVWEIEHCMRSTTSLLPNENHHHHHLTIHMLTIHIAISTCMCQPKGTCSSCHATSYSNPHKCIQMHHHHLMPSSIMTRPCHFASSKPHQPSHRTSGYSCSCE